MDKKIKGLSAKEAAGLKPLPKRIAALMGNAAPEDKTAATSDILTVKNGMILGWHITPGENAQWIERDGLVAGYRGGVPNRVYFFARRKLAEQELERFGEYGVKGAYAIVRVEIPVAEKRHIREDRESKGSLKSFYYKCDRIAPENVHVEEIIQVGNKTAAKIDDSSGMEFGRKRMKFDPKTEMFLCDCGNGFDNNFGEAPPDEPGFELVNRHGEFVSDNAFNFTDNDDNENTFLRCIKCGTLYERFSHDGKNLWQIMPTEQTGFDFTAAVKLKNLRDCECGNGLFDKGFSPCDRDGNDGGFDSHYSLCRNCGRITNDVTGKVVGQKSLVFPFKASLIGSKQAATKYYHGSKKKFEPGFLLTPQADGYVSCDDDFVQQTERILEKNRPEGAMPRTECVFMVGDPEEIDSAGGYMDYVYEVEPIGRVEKNDMDWYSSIGMYLWDDEDDPEAVELAKGYWSGKAKSGTHTLFEYRASQAKVIRLVSSEHEPVTASVEKTAAMSANDLRKGLRIRHMYGGMTGTIRKVLKNGYVLIDWDDPESTAGREYQAWVLEPENPTIPGLFEMQAADDDKGTSLYRKVIRTRQALQTEWTYVNLQPEEPIKMYKDLYAQFEPKVRMYLHRAEVLIGNASQVPLFRGTYGVTIANKYLTEANQQYSQALDAYASDTRFAVNQLELTLGRLALAVSNVNHHEQMMTKASVDVERLYQQVKRLRHKLEGEYIQYNVNNETPVIYQDIYTRYEPSVATVLKKVEAVIGDQKGLFRTGEEDLKEEAFTRLEHARERYQHGQELIELEQPENYDPLTENYKRVAVQKLVACMENLQSAMSLFYFSRKTSSFQIEARPTDAKIDMLKKQYQLDDQMVEQIIQTDPTEKEYVAWIAKQVAENKVRLPEDQAKVKQQLTVFTKLKRSPKFTGNKDILTYDPATLFQTIEENSQSISNKEQRRENVRTGAELIVNQGDYKVYRVQYNFYTDDGKGVRGNPDALKQSVDALIELSGGTNWCTAQPYYAEDYLRQGPTYVMFYKNSAFGQLHPESDQFMDRTDESFTETVAWRDSNDSNVMIYPSAGMIPNRTAREFVNLLSAVAPDVAEWAKQFDANKIPVEKLQTVRQRIQWSLCTGHRMPPDVEKTIWDSKGVTWNSINDYIVEFVKQRVPEWEQQLLGPESYIAGINDYCERVIGGRWPEFEQQMDEKSSIGTTPLSGLVHYCRGIMKGRWQTVEAFINQSLKLGTQYQAAKVAAVEYARDVLHAPWSSLKMYGQSIEQELLDYPDANAIEYAASVLKRWPELEEVLLTGQSRRGTSPGQRPNFPLAAEYAMRVIKGQWVELEEAMLKPIILFGPYVWTFGFPSIESVGTYVESARKSRWPELEEALLNPGKGGLGADHAGTTYITAVNTYLAAIRKLGQDWPEGEARIDHLEKQMESARTNLSYVDEDEDEG